MSYFKKVASKQIGNTIRTRDLQVLKDKTGNLYESIAIASRRADQINLKMKDELQSKLSEFASATDNLEEVIENREQIEISRFYERLPHSVLISLDEFAEDGVYHNIREEEEEEKKDK